MSQDKRIPKIDLHRDFANPIAYKTGRDQVLHLLPLSFDIDNIANNFRKMHRRNILVAQKKGVRVEHGNSLEHLKAFYHLHLQSRRRQGIPVQPWKFFELLGKNLIEKGLGFVSLADKDNECIAAAVFLYWNKTLTYKYAAFNLKARRFCPNNLILWAAIRWGCEQGFSLLDMGRTDIENIGLMEFKRGWGCKEVPLVYSTLSASVARPKTGKLMSELNTIIRHSPLWVCRSAGNLLYKHFG